MSEWSWPEWVVIIVSLCYGTFGVWAVADSINRLKRASVFHDQSKVMLQEASAFYHRAIVDLRPAPHPTSEDTRGEGNG